MRILVLFASIATSFAIAGCGQKPAVSSSAPVQTAAEGPAAPTIGDLSLKVTLTSAPGDQGSGEIDQYLGAPSSLHLGTIAFLNIENDKPMRLIDDVRTGPSITKQDDGSYRIVLTYSPVFGNAFALRPASEIKQLSSIGTHYAGILRQLGLPPDRTKLTHVYLSMNGATVLSQDLDVAIEDEGDGFQAIPVSRPS